jgi:hypothetical protein
MHKIVTAQIAQIPDDACQPVADYPATGVCELAETTLGSERLIVRRVHLHAQDQQTELFAYWRHFAFWRRRGGCSPTCGARSSGSWRSSRG